MREWQRTLFLVLCCGLMWSGCQESNRLPKALEPDFVVLSTLGQVELWHSLTYGWQTLRQGAGLRTGQLVRIRNGGHLIMQKIQKDSNARHERTTFHGPVVSRVGRIAYRLDMLDEDYRSEVIRHKGKSFSGGMTPYHQTLSRILHQLPDHPLTRKAQQVLGTIPERKPRDMRLWLPAPKAVFRPVQFPLEVEVLWQLIPKQTQYHLYVWRSGENRGDPIVIHHTNTYWLKLHRHGSFSVQVTTADEAFATKVRTFHLANPSEGTTKARNGLAMGRKSIQLLVPSADMVFVMRRAPVEIPFGWKVPVTALPWDEYELRIETTSGKLVHQSSHQQFKTTIKLNAGTYRWRVIGRNRERALQKQEVSEMRLLRIESGVPGSWSTVMRELRGAFKSEFGQSFYLEAL